MNSFLIRLLKQWLFLLFILFIPNFGFAQDEVQVESTLEIYNIKKNTRNVVYYANHHLEAPNWTRDGSNLIFNSLGKLFSIPVAGGKPKEINTDFADKCNNDHGLSPDGDFIAISHHEKGSGNSLIYTLPVSGGTPELVTPVGPSYWHGWSPDGKELAYCAERNGEYDIYTVNVKGGTEKRLTTATGLDDGPDYSPNGKWIYFNSMRTGKMKIWRMKTDGTSQTQMTFDDRNDWFPHPSPDGKWIVFVSYESEVRGHPANKNVQIRMMPAKGGKIKELVSLFGGQGTINVPSWSPNSKKFAFVSYKIKK